MCISDGTQAIAAHSYSNLNANTVRTATHT